MSESAHTVLSFDGVSYRYPGRAGAVWAIEGLNLAIAAGEDVALVGGNGSGKTTLAKLACGLLIPDEGRVLVGGNDTADEVRAVQVHSACGYVFQNPDDQLVESILEDEVAFGPVNLGLPRVEVQERVHWALEATGLAGFARREVATLSGGQKQRAAIAGVLALKPCVLVLDEAESMLDPHGRRALQRVLTDLRAQGVATLSITHSMDTALCADRVIALEKGMAVYQGIPQGLFEDEALLDRLGLRTPLPVKMRGLIAACGYELPFCRTIDELAEAIAKAGREESRFDADVSFAQESDKEADPSEDMSRESDGASRGAGATMPNDDRCEERRDRHVVAAFENVSYSYTATVPKCRRSARKAARNFAPNDAPLADAAVDGVSFQVPVGGLIGIAGTTGSGKSTLLKLLAGLMEPTRGSIVRTKPDGEPARIGISFQYPERQLFASTVAEDVTFGPKNLGRDAAAIEADTAWALSCVNVPETLWNRSPFSLSGGEQRRVALAGTLALRPDVLVLDEPTAGQDPAARDDLTALIDRLCAERTTVVLASHDLELLARSEQLLVMEGGHVAMAGTPEQVFSQGDTLARCGLEAPALQALVAKLRGCGIAVPDAATPEALADALAEREAPQGE